MFNKISLWDFRAFYSLGHNISTWSHLIAWDRLLGRSMVGTGILSKNIRSPLSHMLHDILDDDHFTVTTNIDQTLHQCLTPVTDLNLITEFDFFSNCERFPYSICHGAACQQRTLSRFGTCKRSNVENNVSWTCLVIGLLSFKHSSVLLFCLNAQRSRVTTNTCLLFIQMSLKLTWKVIYYCRRQPYFSIELLSKTWYWLGVLVCLGWFHLQGLSRAVRNASRMRIIKWKLLPNVGFELGDLPLTKRKRYHWATRTDVYGVNKSSPDFNCAVFRNLPAAHGRYSQIICRE